MGETPQDYWTPTVSEDGCDKKPTPYHPPTLTVFGSLVELTAAVGRRGMWDGGGRNTKRSMP